MFLSKAERDYLTSNRQFGNDYSYTIKSRLAKKLHQFANQELPLLIKSGYLTEFCKLTDNCKVSNDGVDQPGRALAWGYNNENKKKKKVSLGRELNPRPLPIGGKVMVGPLPYQGNALPG
jgi:hypothetical protein